jgi:hypothetical protein
MLIVVILSIITLSATILSAIWPFVVASSQSSIWPPINLGIGSKFKKFNIEIPLFSITLKRSSLQKKIYILKKTFKRVNSSGLYYKNIIDL